LSFIFFDSTSTGSGPLSAASVQPPPYWKGTSNIMKKSLVVTRVSARSGLTVWPSSASTPIALCMMSLRFGISDSISAVASR
jgi:hypothetical protein